RFRDPVPRPSVCSHRPAHVCRLLELSVSWRAPRCASATPQPTPPRTQLLPPYTHPGHHPAGQGLGTDCRRRPCGFQCLRDCQRFARCDRRPQENPQCEHRRLGKVPIGFLACRRTSAAGRCHVPELFPPWFSLTLFISWTPKDTRLCAG